jgi:hypothetical protein
MITHIKNTQTQDLKGVYFEDINDLVSNKPEAWLVNGWYFRYCSTKEAAEEQSKKQNSNVDWDVYYNNTPRNIEDHS